MNIRLDIDNPAEKKPKLVGLWIKGFGWIIGGDKSGCITIYGKITPVQPLYPTLSEKERIKTQAESVRSFLKRMTEWSFSSDGVWNTK